MTTAWTGESAIAARNASKSASVYEAGRHIRGLWWKIWIASQSRSTPRWTAFAKLPAVETCAPISTRSRSSRGTGGLPGLR